MCACCLWELELNGDSGDWLTELHFGVRWVPYFGGVAKCGELLSPLKPLLTRSLPNKQHEIMSSMYLRTAHYCQQRSLWLHYSTFTQTPKMQTGYLTSVSMPSFLLDNPNPIEPFIPRKTRQCALHMRVRQPKHEVLVRRGNHVIPGVIRHHGRLPLLLQNMLRLEHLVAPGGLQDVPDEEI